MKTTFLILATFVSQLILGQENKKHPIEIITYECHQTPENQTTSGMVKCENEAEENWDKELNKNYKLLLSILTEEEKIALKKSQKSWLDYRDQEFNFSNIYHGNIDGTIYRIISAGRRKEIVKQRALELLDYYYLRTD